MKHVSRIAAVAVSACALLGLSPDARAAFPERQIRMVVSAPAGTAPDVAARLIAPKMSDILGQTVLIENKAGANGGIAATEVSRAPPDGYTVLVTVAGTMTANPYLYPKTAAAGVADLTTVSKIIVNDFLLAARADLPAKDMAELLALMKKEPGKINIATSANGSFPHLAAELFKQKSGLQFGIVRMNGGAAAASAAAGGHVDLVMDTTGVLESLLEGKLIRRIATTGRARNPRSPDTPTVAESGVPGFELNGWVAMLAPPGTPKEIRLVLAKAVAGALADPVVQERLKAIHFEPRPIDPDTFETEMKAERELMGAVVRGAGLVAE